MVHCVLRWGTAQIFRPIAIRLSDKLDDREGSLLDGLTERYQRQGPVSRRIMTGRCSRSRSGFASIAIGIGQNCLPFSTSHESARLGRCPATAKRWSICAPCCRKAIFQSRAPPPFECVATLQRRLGDAGTSFRAISQQLRCTKLEKLLDAGQPLDGVAVELGFSDRRALWRACHRWLGMSPTQYREAKGCVHSVTGRGGRDSYL